MSDSSATKEKKKGSRAGRTLSVIGAALLLCGAFVLSIIFESRDRAEPDVSSSATRTAAVTPAPETSAPETSAAETPAATAAPASLTAESGYFPTSDGLFRPDEAFTPAAAAEIFGALTGRPAATAGDAPFTEETLAAFLETYFSPGAVSDAMAEIRGQGGPEITRAEAAVCLNRLLGVTAPAGKAYYPDVEPTYWAAEDVRAAAGESGTTWTEGGKPLPGGFVNRNGWLYCADEDGYFIKNRYVGTLFFDGGGRYTSGNAELDAYVAGVIEKVTDPSMERIDMLRAVYEYIRDNFTYLKRHYYLVGDLGWQVDEALTMYSTGKGNCYCYSSALWAASRGLGYDAKIVSGTIGVDRSPHGWVEILIDGARYTFDVEIEMAQRRDGYTKGDLFMMSDAKRYSWEYIEAYSDDMVPRETNEGLRPQ